MGSGFRTFQSGEVLTASNVQNYLMEQSVMTFAGTAALGSAIGTAVEPGMVAYLTDSDQIIHYRADAVQGTAWQAMPMVGGAANVVINGAMQVAQRGTSTASITTTGYYTADRYKLAMSSLGTFTQSVENDGPTGSGFRKSLKMLCTTADASPAAGDYAVLEQIIEGQNLQQFLKGTSAAKGFVLTFWVKASATGTYVVELNDTDNGRHTSKSYSVSVADTWEKKTISYSADTTGAFANDNGSSLEVNFWLGAGSTFTSGTLAQTWASYSASNVCPGQTNVAGATNRYWQITGIQLEAGSVATPFEFEAIDETLRKCQRYYEKSYDQSANPGQANDLGNGFYANVSNTLAGSTAGNVGGCGNIPLKVTKRAAPTIVSYDYDGTANALRVGSPTKDAKKAGVTSFANIRDTGAFQFISFDNTSATAIATGDNFSFHWTASAEL